MAIAALRTPEPAPLHWVRPPQQARSRETLERLLDAAEALVAEKGMQAVTLQDVVRRARSSVGAFYARFPDKDALLRTLYARSCDEAVATAELALDPTRWEGTSFADALEQIVEFVVSIFEQRRGLVLASSAAVATDAAYAERAALLGRQLSERMLRFLEARRSEVRHPRLEVAAAFGVRLMLATLEQETVLSRVTPPERALPRTEMARQLARALLGYLGASPSPGKERIP
jgi:AcrR family transcriptional regulator